MNKLGTDADFRVADTYNSSALAWCMLNAAKLLDEAIVPMVELLLKHGADAQCVEAILKHKTSLQLAEEKRLALCLAAMQQTIAAGATQQRKASAGAAAAASNRSGSSRSNSSNSSSSNSNSSSNNSICTDSSSINSSNSNSSYTNRPISQTTLEVLDLLDSGNNDNTDDVMVVEAPSAAVNRHTAASTTSAASAVQAVQQPTAATASESSMICGDALQKAMTASSGRARGHTVNMLQGSASTVHTGADDDKTESEYEHCGSGNRECNDSDDDYVDCDTNDGVARDHNTASACLSTLDAAVVAAYTEAVARTANSSGRTRTALPLASADQSSVTVTAAAAASTAQPAAATAPFTAAVMTATAAAVAEQAAITDERDRLIAELKAKNAALRALWGLLFVQLDDSMISAMITQCQSSLAQ
jgi:hypothetical protein